jgi:beta-galactosidase beta subunit
VIIAHFKDIDNYKELSKNLDKALEYLKYVDMSMLEDGKTFISGEDVFSVVSTYNTRER